MTLKTGTNCEILYGSEFSLGMISTIKLSNIQKARQKGVKQTLNAAKRKKSPKKHKAIVLCPEYFSI